MDNSVTKVLQEKRLKCHASFLRHSDIVMNRLSIMIDFGMGSSFIVPTPLVGGGTICSNGVFFVQTILADRCIHRREMWVISIKSSPRVKFEINNFFNFVFLEELFKNSWEHWIFGSLLFPFSVYFVRFNIFFLQIFFQNSHLAAKCTN